ncbi:hypothetical protein [Nitratidesulfovibrio liaohensis]|uniref:PilZ domain-containing protein n=1 Tax=Nitratidesulfovibrio liaohensis TaxID=2604158 RepID=A0ABY9R8U9_9BACT|nr:hypothetical protein [Nitratidesulfovibrio liaohensis]WMW67065.1 hypothetical protein KPS_001710 [Nitratidesulfovibrio liaohensis]
MSTERTAGGMPAATADDEPDARPGLAGTAGMGGTDGAAAAHADERRREDRRREDRRQDDRRREDRQLRAALPLAVEAARGMAHRALPDRPAASREGFRSGGGPGLEGTARARCCACGSRDVWLLHDGVLHLVGCRRCGRTGPGALSAPLAVEVWNSADESRFCRGLPPDAEMMAPCVCEAPPPEAGVAVAHPAHLRPLGSQVMPAPVRVHRLSPYGAQLSGQCETLCPWLEGTEGALCELALPMADGRGWTLFALRVESARREGDDLFVGGAFVRQGERQRGLLARLLDVAAVNEKGQGDEALAVAN